jgi:FtsH-binding integral membrane protein
MNTAEQNKPEYQEGGFANYQGPPESFPAQQAQYPQGFNDQEDLNIPSQGNMEQYKIEEEIDSFTNATIRQGFIKKTYGILLSQLIITTFFIALTFFDSVKQLIRFNYQTNPIMGILFFVVIIATTVIFIMFACCRETARKVPTNYILLFTYTFCMCFYLLILCSEYSTKAVFTALVLTVAATLGLTIYSFTTTHDFTFCSGILFAFITVLIFSFPFFLWFGSYTFYCILGVMCYSFYLIYDTQLILGKFGIEYNIDDYCFAALNLYIDIIYLFIKILYLIGNSIENK